MEVEEIGGCLVRDIRVVKKFLNIVFHIMASYHLVLSSIKISALATMRETYFLRSLFCIFMSLVYPFNCCANKYLISHRRKEGRKKEQKGEL